MDLVWVIEKYEHTITRIDHGSFNVLVDMSQHGKHFMPALIDMHCGMCP